MARETEKDEKSPTAFAKTERGDSLDSAGSTEPGLGADPMEAAVMRVASADRSDIRNIQSDLLADITGPGEMTGQVLNGLYRIQEVIGETLLTNDVAKRRLLTRRFSGRAKVARRCAIGSALSVSACPR